MAKSGKITATILKQSTPSRVNDGNGLWLTTSPAGSKRWTIRHTYKEKRREMGIGGYPTISQEEAQETARQVKRWLRAGLDPMEEYRRSILAKEREKVPTFKECAVRCIDARRSEWRNPKHAKQWAATIKAYANPIIGDLPVDMIGVDDVLEVLTPIWEDKTETASRLRGRIERVLSWATVLKYRQGPNPAVWRGNLAELLAKPSKVRKVKHHPALPFDDVGQFMADLRQREGIAALALQILILTACRSGEIRGMTWSEINFDTMTWSLSADRTKQKKAHTIPLSDQAVQLLESMPVMVGEDLVFTSSHGNPLSDMALTSLTRRMKAPCVPHGFRSSFRDWSSERTTYANQVCEAALGHTIGDKVEAAYRRGELLEKRRPLMQAWADFCDVVQAKKTASVTSIRAAR